MKLASLGGGRARARRHRHVGRQPRPGGRLSRAPARHPGDHRDAGDDAVREGGGDARARRRGRARRRNASSEAQARAEAMRASAGYVSVHPYDDARIIAGPGHDRARDAGGGAGARRAGGADRRRRPDCRQRDRGASAVGPRSRSSASKPRSIRRCGTRSRARTGRSAARRLAEGIAVKNVGSANAPDRARTRFRHRARRRAALRARGQRVSHAAEDDGRRGRCGRARRHAGRAGTLSGPQGRSHPVRRQH